MAGPHQAQEPTDDGPPPARPQSEEHAMPPLSRRLNTPIVARSDGQERFTREREVYGDESLPIDLEGGEIDVDASSHEGRPPEVQAIAEPHALTTARELHHLDASSARAVTQPRPPKVRAGGVCLECEYDLRGCPDAARCPECGAPVSTASSRRKLNRVRNRVFLFWPPWRLAQLRWATLFLWFGLAALFAGVPVVRYLTARDYPAIKYVAFAVSLGLLAFGAHLAGLLSPKRIPRRLAEDPLVSAGITPDEARLHRLRSRGLIGTFIAFGVLLAVQLASIVVLKAEPQWIPALMAIGVAALFALVCHGLREIARELEDEPLADRFWNLVWGHAVVGSISAIIVVQVAGAMNIPVICLGILLLPAAWIVVFLLTAWSIYRVGSLAAWAVRYHRNEAARQRRLQADLAARQATASG